MDDIIDQKEHQTGEVKRYGGHCRGMHQTSLAADGAVAAETFGHTKPSQNVPLHCATLWGSLAALPLLQSKHNFTGVTQPAVAEAVCKCLPDSPLDSTVSMPQVPARELGNRRLSRTV